MNPYPHDSNYMITREGKVWSLRNKIFLKEWSASFGYPVVRLGGKSKKNMEIHRLVLETYVGDRPTGTQCRHLDGDPKNNNLSNLKWGSISENRKDMWRHSRINGTKVGCQKLYPKDVRKIRRLYAKGKLTQKKLGEMFGVHKQTISDILLKRNWKWLL